MKLVLSSVCTATCTSQATHEKLRMHLTSRHSTRPYHSIYEPKMTFSFLMQ